MNEVELYRRAARLAFIAMGKKQGPIGRGYTRPYAAHDDPLAHWELTECIVALTRKAALDREMTDEQQAELRYEAGMYQTIRYLIWSNEHRAWWKPWKNGYTTATHHAGQYSLEEATEIVTRANYYSDKVNEVMVEAPSREQIELDLIYPDR